MTPSYYFENITLLITHYNRSGSLERLLTNFNRLHCRFHEIIVSDDGSRIEHLEKVKSLQGQYQFKLITSPENKGLGHNINKGQDAASAPYTLYIQEDFVPNTFFPVRIKQSLEFMDEITGLDLVRFYAYFKYPYLKPYRDGFSEMQFRIWYLGYQKFYVYSDHPHLRRSNFLEKFGRYAEGMKGDITEYRMMISFLQKKGMALYYDDYNGLLYTVNNQIEPSTMEHERNFWRKSENFFVSRVRHVYRHIKFNMDYFFLKAR